MKHALLGWVAYGVLLNDFVINRNINKHSSTLGDNVDDDDHTQQISRHSSQLGNVDDVAKLANVESTLTNELLERTKREKLEGKIAAENKLAEKEFGHTIHRTGKNIKRQLTKDFKKENRRRKLLDKEKELLAADERRIKKENKIFEGDNHETLVDHSKLYGSVDSLISLANQDVDAANTYLSSVDTYDGSQHNKDIIQLDAIEQRKKLLDHIRNTECDPCEEFSYGCEEELAKADDILRRSVDANEPDLDSEQLISDIHSGLDVQI